jgi:hypothetical protein
MPIPAGFFTTRITVEVEVHTQFGPEAAIQLVRDRLKVPAVNAVRVTVCATNYAGPHCAPDKYLHFTPVSG